jgi:hypothetical protein
MNFIKEHSVPLFLILSAIVVTVGQYVPELPVQEIVSALAVILGVKGVSDKVKENKAPTPVESDVPEESRKAV